MKKLCLAAALSLSIALPVQQAKAGWPVSVLESWPEIRAYLQDAVAYGSMIANGVQTVITVKDTLEVQDELLAMEMEGAVDLLHTINGLSGMGSGGLSFGSRAWGAVIAAQDEIKKLKDWNFGLKFDGISISPVSYYPKDLSADEFLATTEQMLEDGKKNIERLGGSVADIAKGKYVKYQKLMHSPPNSKMAQKFTTGLQAEIAQSVAATGQITFNQYLQSVQESAKIHAKEVRENRARSMNAALEAQEYGKMNWAKGGRGVFTFMQSKGESKYSAKKPANRGTYGMPYVPPPEYAGNKDIIELQKELAAKGNPLSPREEIKSADSPAFSVESIVKKANAQ